MVATSNNNNILDKLVLALVEDMIVDLVINLCADFKNELKSRPNDVAKKEMMFAFSSTRIKCGGWWQYTVHYVVANTDDG